MSREAITERFGTITGFLPADADHPIAAGLPAGSITDDTEQAMLLARHLVAHAGRLEPRGFASELVAWENDMRARGSLDLLGPSTRTAVAAVVSGAPVETAGRYGTTNGASMRVTPVGIAVGPGDLAHLVDRVAEASFVTHNTGVAIAAASAVAAAVSAGVDGATVREAIPVAIRAAELGATRGYWVAGADVARRIEWAVTLGTPTEVYELVGTSLASQESVPAAFALLAQSEYPWQAVTRAASLGGDSDTIAAIVGAIAGACGGAFPDAAVETVRTVNRLDLVQLAEELLALR
jgi:ADP-ribosylglycohydrolase